jgi:hypothetical protein
VATPPLTLAAPLTGLFPRLGSRREAERYRLDEAQGAAFRENGYLAGIRVLG